MFEQISQIAVTVISGALLAVGIGMINVGNRTRKLATRLDAVDDRCHSHGLPYSDVTQRLTELEGLVEGRIRIGELALQEMRDGNVNLMKRIDALDTKMHRHVEKVETNLRAEIRRVNGKVENQHA